MFIHELTEKAKQKILSLLESEEFVSIKQTTNTLSFRKGLRQYTLLSTNLQDHEDGLRIDFDYKAFMKAQYEEKTRHSVSLRDAVDKAGSVEEGCRKLHWKISRVENMLAKNSPWIAELHTDFIYEVKIGDHVHILVNENEEGAEGGLKVYAGSMDALWAMGTAQAEDLLLNSELPSLVQDLDHA